MRKTWEENKAACEAAFIAAFGMEPDAWRGKFAWCCHHSQEIEELSEHWSARIECIATQKPVAERATRFDNFRPVLSDVAISAWAEYERVRASALAEYERVRAPAWAEYQRVRASAHLADVPHYTWNGKTIFQPRETEDSK